MSKKISDLWIDSETDSSTTCDTASINEKPFTGESTEVSKRNCCLICSILSSLSNVNCCQKHLALLTTSLPTQAVYMMSTPAKNHPQLEDQCSKLKQKSRLWRKQRPVTLASFSKNESLLSPNRKRSTSYSIESRSNQLNHLSSSLAKTTMNNNNSRKRQRTSIVRNKSIPSSTDPIESNLPVYSPRILLTRVIHVKDDDDNEELPVNQSQIVLNMSQATKQMAGEKYGHPKILLKRVCFEQ